jgi:hypothetical protein
MKSPTLNSGAPGLKATIKFFWNFVISEGFPSLGVIDTLRSLFRTTK